MSQPVDIKSLAKQVVNEEVPLHLIRPHQQNYNQHPFQQIRELEESYKELSQFRSLVLWRQEDGTFVQLAGEGITTAMRNQGAETVRADIWPVETPPDLAKRILLADNLHARHSQPNQNILADLLNEQDQAHSNLAALGTNRAELNNLLLLITKEPSIEHVQESAVLHSPLLHMPAPQPFLQSVLQSDSQPDAQEEVRESMRIEQGRVAEVPTSRAFKLAPDGTSIGRSADDALRQFETTTLRQIVIVSQKEQYSWFLSRMAALRKAYGLSTHAAVIELVLQAYFDQHPEIEVEDESA